LGGLEIGVSLVQVQDAPVERPSDPLAAGPGVNRFRRATTQVKEVTTLMLGECLHHLGIPWNSHEIPLDTGIVQA